VRRRRAFALHQPLRITASHINRSCGRETESVLVEVVLNAIAEGVALDSRQRRSVQLHDNRIGIGG
jgi:hypothetical protein